ncbi:hypothetical protein PG990_006540 [Apiospora arundinis]|uniref:Uncharacterized protein n=1 Tax=Apiospora arundinis TaxID=335852 RepID=A0ABR2JAS8_9PEZI
MKKFLSTHWGSLRRKNREPKEPTLTEANPFTIPRSVSYRKANPRLPEPRKVVSLGSVRRPSTRPHEYGRQSVDVVGQQEAGRPLAKSSSRENPPWAIAAGPKLKQKVVSHPSIDFGHRRRNSEQHPALRQGGANQTEQGVHHLKISPPVPPRPEETTFKPRQASLGGGYGQTLDTAGFKERSDVPPRLGPLKGIEDRKKPAEVSDELDKGIVDHVEDLSWAVESGLNLTNTVDCDRITTHRPAVTHEHVRPQVREVREERIHRDIHNYDIYPQIQPIYELEILPARHFIEDADGNRTEVAESDLPCCTGGNQRWRIGLEELKNRTTPFSTPFIAPPPQSPQRRSQAIEKKEKETGAEVLPTDFMYRVGSIGRSYSPAQGMSPVQGETFRRGYRSAVEGEGLQSVPRIMRQGRESLMSDNQTSENVAVSGTRTFA